MGSFCLGKRLSNKKMYICHILFSFIIFILVYKNRSLYSWTMLSIRCILSMVILFSIFTTYDYEDDCTYFVELGYVISNMILIITFIIQNEFINLHKVLLVASLIEANSFIVNIRYLEKEEENKNKSKSKVFFSYQKNIVLLCILILHLNLKVELIRINNTPILLLDIVIGFALLYLIFIVKKLKNSDLIKNNQKFLATKNVMIIKIISFIFILVLPKVLYKKELFPIITEFLSLLQIYLVYEIIVNIRIVSPYKKLRELNEIVVYQEDIEKNKNIILKSIREKEYELKEKVKLNEEFLDSIFSSSSNGWIIFDENQNIKYVNKAFQGIVGYKKNILEAIEDSMVNKKDFTRGIIDAYNKKTIEEIEVEFKEKGIYRCTYIPQVQEHECICIFTDINKEKEILDNLIELNEEYEDLIVNIKSPVFISDDKNNIIKCSKSYEKIFDIDSAYISEDKYLNEIVYIKDRRKYKEVLDINKKAKSNEELYNGGFFRYRVLDKEGEIAWLEANTTVYYDEDKKNTITSFSDITEYIESTSYLMRMESIYKSLLDSIPEGIYLEDLETNKYIFVNKKFKDIFSVDLNLSQNNLGFCRKDLMRAHPDSEELIDREMSIIRENKVFNYTNVKYIDDFNNTINARVASMPFRLKGKTLKLTIIKDMKDIKRLEILRKKITERKKQDSLKTEFFINMSHELKTPLNLIFTGAQLLDSLLKKGRIHDENGYIKDHIVLVRENTFRLIRIIENLIEFTKMESGFYQLKIEEKDIVSLVEDMVMSVVCYAENKGVKIIFDTDLEELFIGVDVNAIERIVINILSNSIKFTNEGGYIYVNIVDKGEKIDIVIEDTGIGIPKEKIGSIFDRFTDVNKGFAGNTQGSGIGLSMVKSMAKLIDAKIKVESEVDKGTKFTVTLNIESFEGLKHIDENNVDAILNVERLALDIER